MSYNPLVSIIIPCFNHGRYLMDTVNSALAQTYQNIEIIIVNDGSTDEFTLQLLNKINDPKIKTIHQPNYGPAVARNYAIEVSGGEYILPLDADDMIRKETILKSIGIFEGNNKVAVVYGNNQCFGAENNLRKQGTFETLNMLIANPVALCTVIRKSAIIDVGGFDENLSRNGLEDWDLWLSLIEKGWEFRYKNEVFFDIRIDYNSRTFEVANKNLEKLVSYIYKKHSALIAEYYIHLYHENKNLKNTFDFRLGNLILKPFRKKILNK